MKIKLKTSTKGCDLFYKTGLVWWYFGWFRTKDEALHHVKYAAGHKLSLKAALKKRNGHHTEVLTVEGIPSK